MENPFESITYTKRERKLLEPDVYIGVLTEVKKVAMPDKENPGQKKDKLIFSYFIESQDAELAAFFNVAMGENAGVIKFLTKSYGAATIDAIRQDKGLLWAFIQDMVGKDFKLFVSLNGKYNNIDSAIPVKKVAAVVPPTPKDAREIIAATEMTDDDIPF
jgi:hypothetical protein